MNVWCFCARFGSLGLSVDDASDTFYICRRLLAVPFLRVLIALNKDSKATPHHSSQLILYLYRKHRVMLKYCNGYLSSYVCLSVAILIILYHLSISPLRAYTTRSTAWFADWQINNNLLILYCKDQYSEWNVFDKQPSGAGYHHCRSKQ